MHLWSSRCTESYPCLDFGKHLKGISLNVHSGVSELYLFLNLNLIEKKNEGSPSFSYIFLFEQITYFGSQLFLSSVLRSFWRNWFPKYGVCLNKEHCSQQMNALRFSSHLKDWLSNLLHKLLIWEIWFLSERTNMHFLS